MEVPLVKPVEGPTMSQLNFLASERREWRARQFSWMAKSPERVWFPANESKEIRQTRMPAPCAERHRESVPYRAVRRLPCTRLELTAVADDDFGFGSAGFGAEGFDFFHDVHA